MPVGSFVFDTVLLTLSECVVCLPSIITERAVSVDEELNQQLLKCYLSLPFSIARYPWESHRVLFYPVSFVFVLPLLTHYNTQCVTKTQVCFHPNKNIRQWTYQESTIQEVIPTFIK